MIYLAGADPLEGDSPGRLSLSKAGLRRRGEWVLSTWAALALPTVIVMAGGYPRCVDDIVDIHIGTLVAASNAWGVANRSN
ncbi:MAG: hypothetical protein WBR18_07890 [Anaerolineales bacterium]